MLDALENTYRMKGPDKIRRYYSIFINTMAAIARNFGAKIIKNTGTGLIYFFPKTSLPSSNNLSAFKDVIECGITSVAAKAVINTKLNEEQLPPLHYKISADYGTFKFPETYVIDAKGNVVRKYIGPEDWTSERMVSDIRSLL